MDRSASRLSVLMLPVDVIEQVLCELTAHDLRRWKTCCSFGARLGRRVLSTSETGPACITREVAFAWWEGCGEQGWRTWLKGRARTLFSHHASAFVAGFEFWPREQLRKHGVDVLSEMLRYTSRTRAPIGSDIGLQVLLELVEDWEDMERAWLLLPAAMRRSGRPHLDDILPLIESWSSAHKIAALLMHEVRSMVANGHLLIAQLLNTWALPSMSKAAAVVLNTDGCLAAAKGEYGYGTDWRLVLTHLHDQLEPPKDDERLYMDVHSKWDAFFAAARRLALMQPQALRVVLLTVLNDGKLVGFPRTTDVTQTRGARGGSVDL